MENKIDLKIKNVIKYRTHSLNIFAVSNLDLKNKFVETSFNTN